MSACSTVKLHMTPTDHVPPPTPPAGLPYGWDEAFTADGVKYYIK